MSGTRRFPVRSFLTALAKAARRVRGGARDIEGRPAQERAPEVLQSVVDHVIDGVITIDEHGVIRSFNPAAEKIFGYPSASVLGKNVNMLMPEPYSSEHDGYIARYFRTGEAKIIGIGREVVGQRSDGSTFPMDLAVSEFLMNDRPFFTGIIRDITERKLLEKELHRRLSELAKTDRLKDEFLAMLAHELRNPIAAIMSAVQLAGVLHDKEQSELSLEIINRQVQHLARLIDDLLDVSRITRGKINLQKQTVNLASIVESSVASVRTLIDERKHELVISMPAEPLWLEADPTRLEQILSNLLNNAAKYTENGGRITLSAVREEREIVIRVRDTGIGMSPEMLPRMFELFAQGDRSLARSEGGLGLGLTLARSLTEIHGGNLSATSEGPGKGTEFVVRLPAAETPKGSDNAVKDAIDVASVRPARVLVVDDNVDTARSIARLLNLLGHNVEIAHDGPTAIEAARAFRPDVFLLDIGLPTMDGYEVARLLRAEDCGKDARIIAITGYGQEEDRKRSLAAGFDHHLIKPVDFGSLVTLLTGTAV